MRRKKVIPAASLFVLGMLMAGCANDPETLSYSEADSSIIRLRVNDGFSRVTSDPQSNILSEGNLIGAFGVANGNFISNGNNNQYSVASDHSLEATVDDMRCSNGNTVEVYAYAPFNETWDFEAENTFTVASDQSNQEGYISSDLVYAVNKDVTPGEDVELNFNHRMAKLVLKFINYSELDLSSAKVVVTASTQTTFNPSSGEMGEASLVGEIIAAESLSENTAQLLLPPQELKADKELLKITVSDKSLSGHLTSDATLNGGKAYTLSIKVGDEGLSLKMGNVSLEDWEDGDDENQEPEEETYIIPLNERFVEWDNFYGHWNDGRYTWYVNYDDFKTSAVSIHTLSSEIEFSKYKTLNFRLSNTGANVNDYIYIGFDINGDQSTLVGPIKCAIEGDFSFDITTWGLKSGSKFFVAGPGKDASREGNVTFSDLNLSTKIK